MLTVSVTMYIALLVLFQYIYRILDTPDSIKFIMVLYFDIIAVCANIVLGFINVHLSGSKAFQVP